MSRLRRSKVRLERAQTLLETVQNTNDDQHPLDLSKTLLRILKDIPASKLFPINVSEEWTTVMTVLKAAVEAGIINLPSSALVHNIPADSSISRDKYLMSVSSENLSVIGQYLLGSCDTPV